MNLKRPISIIGLGTLFLLNGCVSDHQPRYNDVLNQTDTLKQEEHIFKKYHKETDQKAKKIKINAHNQWAYAIVKRIAKKYKIPLDNTFIPAKEYKVSAKGKYSFNGVLAMIYRQTGIKYSIEDGYLKVRNQEIVNEYERAIRCTKGNTFSISLKNTPIEKIFDGLIKDDYNVVYDTKYYNIGNSNSSLPNFRKVDFFYKGCSKREAIRNFGKVNDLDITFRGKDVFVRDYKTIELNIPAPFKSKYSSDTSRIGETNAKAGLRLSDANDPAKEMARLVQMGMSSRGRAFLSNKGYIIATDTPQSIKNLKKYLKKEMEAQQNIEMEITIISIELNDAYKSGVDWSGVFERLGKEIGVRNLALGVSAPLEEASNAFSVSGLIDNKNQLLQFLGEYGKSKVVKTYRINTRSGTVSSLKSVDVIPYVTTTTVTSNGVSESSDEAKSTESGIVLNIKPTYDKGYVNMNIDASLSQYLGDKEVKTGYMLPLQTDNKIQTVITTKVGSTAILTGLKLKSKKLNFKGLPKVQNSAILSTLGGQNDDEVESKEYLIFISPKKLYR